MWADPYTQLVREADALRASRPDHAGWMLVAAARISIDLAGDTARGEALLSKAETIAGGSRVVASARRWAAEHTGRLPDVLQHARVELDRAASPAERVDLLCRMAALEELVGAKPDVAETYLKEAVSVDATDLASALALACLYARHTRWPEATTIWDQLAAHIADPEVQAAWLVASGTVREAYLSDVAGARASLERAVAVDANDVFARSALEPILHRAEAWADYGQIMQSHARQLEDDAPTASQLYDRAGDVLWEAAHDAAAAATAYELASSVVPGELGPLFKLAAVLESRADTTRLEGVYNRILSLTHEPVVRASVCFKLGVLAETQQQPDKALAAFQSALEAMPTFMAAAESLEALCIRLERWDLLVGLLRAEAERVTAPAARAARYVRIADLYAGRLDNVQEAMGYCERALALDPTQLLAFDLIERILRERRDLDGVASLYEKAVESARDTRLARALRWELASLHLAAHGPDRAVPLLKSALGEQDELPVLMQLGRALGESAQWAEMVAVLESQARLLTHPPTLVASLYRIAVMVETRLADAGRALGAYARVLEKAPDHEGALEGMLRILVQQSRWDEAVGLERRLAGLAGRPEDAAARLYRAGWILEARLGRIDDAVSAYESSLSKLPTYVPAAMALERVLRGAGQSARLAAMYEARAGLETEPAAKAAALVRAASIYELRLNEPAKALQALDRAISACPGCENAQWARLRIHEVQSDWRACSSDLRALLGSKTHPATRAGLLARAARLHEFRLGELPRAAILVEEAMACGPGRRFLVLDRLRTAFTAGHSSAAHRWLAEAAGHTADRRWAAAACRQRMFGLMYSGGSLADVEEACTRTLANRPADVQALEGLASVLMRRRELVGAVPVMVRGARQVEHPASRALLLFAAGAVAENNGDRSGALDIYGESLKAMADNIAALHGLRRLAITASDWRSVVQSCQRIAEASADSHNVAAAWLEAGDVHMQQLGTPMSAVQAYRSVLARQPDHVVAFERAAGVIEKEEEWAELAQLMADHLAAVRDEPRRVEMLQRRARVLSDRMGRIHDAIAEMDKAVRAVPAPQLVSFLAGLYERDKQWQNAVQTWQKLASIVTDAPARSDALYRQATLLSLQLGEYEQARAILEPLVTQPQDIPVPREAYVRLAEVYAHLGQSQPARDLYRQLGAVGTPEERLDALLATATISDKELGDHSGTQEAIEKGFEIAVSVPAVLPTIEAYFQRTGAWQRYVALADRVSDRAPASAPGKLALRMSVARVYRGKLRTPELADMHLRTTVEMFPKSTEPRLALGFGLVGSNDQGALAELRGAVQIDPFCQEAYQAIASICHRMGMSGCAAYAATAASLLGDENAEIAGAGALEPIPNSLLPDDALTLLVGPTRTRALRRVVQVLDSQIHTVFPVGPEVIAGLARLPEGFSAAVAVRALAAALGAKPLTVYRGGQRALTLLMTETRSLVFGADQVTGPGFPQGMFEACWMIACVAAGSGMIHGLSRSQWLGLLVACVDSNGSEGDPEFRKRVMSALPRRARKDLERIAEEDNVDVRAEYPIWEAEERSRALRIAVTMSRDLRVVARSLAPKALATSRPDERRTILIANELMGEALRFAVSDACWGAHVRLFGRK